MISLAFISKKKDKEISSKFILENKAVSGVPYLKFTGSNKSI